MKKIVLLWLTVPLAVAALCQTDTAARPLLSGQGQSVLVPRSLNSILYNGIEHLPHAPSIEGSGYLLPDWEKGSVVYEGVRYDDVLLKFDLLREELVVRHENGLPVVLFTPRVSAFRIGERNFQSINSPAGKKPVLAGFYEIIADGPLQLLAKRKVSLEERVASSGMQRRFSNKTEYFAQKSGNWFSLRNEGSLLDLLENKRNAARDYLRDNGISYRNNPEGTLITIAQFYNNN